METDEVRGGQSQHHHPRHLQKEALAEYLENTLSIKLTQINRPLIRNISAQPVLLPMVKKQPLPLPELLSVSEEATPTDPVKLQHWKIGSSALDTPIKALSEIQFGAYLLRSRRHKMWLYFCVTQEVQHIM